jgi:hypothetical protein
MRSSLLLVFAIYISITTYSQAICGFDEVHRQKMQNDPIYKKAVEENEKAIQKFIIRNKNKISTRTGTDGLHYIIPVVVHIIHTGGAVGSIYNPTDEQITGAIDYLNQVYNGSYPGTQGIGDLQIQFALAVRGVNCSSTTGIERIDASFIPGYIENGVSTDPDSIPGTSESTIKNLSRWNPFQYYNIWVVNKIDGQDGTSGVFKAGYAYYPTASPQDDGTVILATQMGSGQKTLPHEMGHAFGLLHPFEGSADRNMCPPVDNCAISGDGVCDTDPITYNKLDGVYDFTCRSGINSCTGTAYTINTESNYMNYTNCYTLFTAGQKARLLASAAGPYRNKLSASSAASADYPVAPFSPPIQAVCNPSTSTTGLSGAAAGILNVELNNRSFPSLNTPYDNGYVDGATNCLNLIQLIRGSAYTIHVTVAGINEEQVKAWIDFNDDGVFTASEEILSDNSIDKNSPTASNTFIVPPTVPLNTTLRMRVIDELSNTYLGVSTITDGCFNPVYGQAEDYPVFITSGTLPVTLSGFTGVLKNNSVVLSWSTSWEQWFKNFEIEKSIDGSRYQKIGTVNSARQSSASHTYSFTDIDLSPNNYYRLRMNDNNGDNKLSNVIYVRSHVTSQQVQVLNNPFTSYIEIKLNKACSQVKLQLINSMGVVVAEKSVGSVLGAIKWDVPITVSKGAYIVKIITGGEMFASKVVKQ